MNAVDPSRAPGADTPGQTGENVCPQCGGTGRTADGQRCERCQGAGRVIEPVGDA